MLPRGVSIGLVHICKHCCQTVCPDTRLCPWTYSKQPVYNLSHPYTLPIGQLKLPCFTVKVCLELPATYVPCKSAFSTTVLFSCSSTTCNNLSANHSITGIKIYCGVSTPLIAYLTNGAANAKYSPSVSAFALVHILSTFFGVRAGQSDGRFKNMSAI